MQTTSELIGEVQQARRKLAEGQRDEAVVTYDTLVERSEEDIALNNELGHLALELGAPVQAINHYRYSVDQEPDNIGYRGFLGIALEKRGELDEAGEVLHDALARGNDHYRVLDSLGLVYAQRNDHRQARVYLEQALERKPSEPKVRKNLATALVRLGEHEEALECARKGEKYGASNQAASQLIGQVLSELGRVDEAITHFEKMIQRHKTHGEAYRALSVLKKFSAEDKPFIAQTEKTLERSMPPDARVSFHFALAKMYDDCKEPEKAFAHYQKGNTLQRTVFDIKEVERGFKRIRKFFDRSTVARLRTRGHESAQPVFVVGMPRSGTTLIERMIAAHPRAAGAGELAQIGVIQGKVDPDRHGPRARARARAALTRERMHQYAEEYLEVLRRESENADRIVDKMPGNAMFLGLITSLFPNATIINAIRHPLDIGLSCYFQRFTSITWANDLSTIAEMYRINADMIAHWKKVLPEGQIVDVHYENLVQDPEGEGKRLLQACGLDWDEDVLNFYKKDGKIRTASLAQVRRPVYDSSRMRWVGYAPWLGELAWRLEPYLPEDRKTLEKYGMPMPGAMSPRRLIRHLRAR